MLLNGVCHNLMMTMVGTSTYSNDKLNGWVSIYGRPWKAGHKTSQDSFTPIFDPVKEKKDIKEQYIAWLYRMMAYMLSWDPSVVNMYDLRCWFNHCALTVKAIPQDCLQDLYWLLHFVEEWNLAKMKTRMKSVITGKKQEKTQ